MASFDEEFEYDPQPDLDVDFWISSLESDSDLIHTPKTPDESEDVPRQSSQAPTPIEVESELDSPSSIDLDIKPLAIRSCRATRSRIAKRDPTPESSSGESEFSEYELSPKVRPTRLRQMRQDTSEERSISPPLVGIKSEPISPSSSPRSGSMKGKTTSTAKPKPKSKRGSGRKGEPRRTQNMVAQKKYRDKRVNAAHLMSDTIVQLRAADNDGQSPKSYADLVRSILCQYQVKVQNLDPNLAWKQDTAVECLSVQED